MHNLAGLFHPIVNIMIIKIRRDEFVTCCGSWRLSSLPPHSLLESVLRFALKMVTSGKVKENDNQVCNSISGRGEGDGILVHP